MIQYLCDTCSAVKKPQEPWMVGLAAEAVGATSARREVSIQSVWDRQTAVHPLAVHFCSVQCKDEYMAKLFAPEVSGEADAEIAMERNVPSEVVIERTIPARRVTKSKVSRRTHHRKKRAA